MRTAWRYIAIGVTTTLESPLGTCVMPDDFLVRAALAGIGVALAAPPLGCFIVWRRMAYFGDATAHAAMLGVALSLTLSTPIFAGVLLISLLMAVTVSTLTGRGYAMDTLLGVMAHSALAVGLGSVSFLSGVRIDLMAYLFGDILAVGRSDLAIIWGGALLVLIMVGYRWSALLLSTLNPELALASVAGLSFSYHFDSPTGPSIVCVVAFLFVVLNAINAITRRVSNQFRSEQQVL